MRNPGEQEPVVASAEAVEERVPLGVFNIDGLSLLQIQMLGRGLYAGFDQESESVQSEDGATDPGSFERQDTAARLIESLVSSISKWSTENPQRGVDLLNLLAYSTHDNDKELAAECTRPLLATEFDVTFRALSHLRDHRYSTFDSSDIARDVMHSAIDDPDTPLSGSQISKLRRELGIGDSDM